MSKVAIATASAGVVAVGSVGGVYLTGGFGGSAVEPIQHSPAPKSFSPTIVSNTLNQFKDGKVGDCATSYFPGLTFNTFGSALADQDVATADFFNGTGTAQPDSCFFVNWTKSKLTDKGKENKWRGEFRLTWSLVKGHRGFTMFSLVKSQDADPEKFDLEAGLYLVEKVGDSWSFRENKEKKTEDVVFTYDSKPSRNPRSVNEEDEEEDDDDALEDVDQIATIPPNYMFFGSPGYLLSMPDPFSKHWGFFDGSYKLKDSADSGPLSFQRSWTWSPSTGQTKCKVWDILDEPMRYLANLFGVGISRFAPAMKEFGGDWIQNQQTTNE